jgi:hypothetical protein
MIRSSLWTFFVENAKHLSAGHADNFTDTKSKYTYLLYQARVLSMYCKVVRVLEIIRKCFKLLAAKVSNKYYRHRSRGVVGLERSQIARNPKISIVKAELLQLNHAQFPSLGIFVSKKVGNRKN